MLFAMSSIFLNHEGYTQVMEKANCIGIDPNIFFPEQYDWKAMNVAKAICEECVVKTVCLEDNLNETIGVFGGTSARERLRIRSSRAGS